MLEVSILYRQIHKYIYIIHTHIYICTVKLSSHINFSGFNKKKKDTAKHKWSNHHHIFFAWLVSLQNQWFHKLWLIRALKEKSLRKLPSRACVCASSFFPFYFLIHPLRSQVSPYTDFPGSSLLAAQLSFWLFLIPHRTFLPIPLQTHQGS